MPRTNHEKTLDLLVLIILFVVLTAGYVVGYYMGRADGINDSFAGLTDCEDMVDEIDEMSSCVLNSIFEEEE